MEPSTTTQERTVETLGRELTLRELFAADRARGEGASGEPVDVDYMAEITRLCSQINTKDVVFRDNINHAGTVNNRELKAVLGQICYKLTIISNMYSQIPEICNQITDIITKYSTARSSSGGIYP
jgi:hypothetical protein